LLRTSGAVFRRIPDALVARNGKQKIHAQIGLVTLGGLAAKNAILIVEFAKTKYEEWMGLVEAALEGAKLRFRPILVIGGILAATFIAVFLIPVLFYFVEKFIGKKKKRRRSS